MAWHLRRDLSMVTHREGAGTKCRVTANASKSPAIILFVMLTIVMNIKDRDEYNAVVLVHPGLQERLYAYEKGRRSSKKIQVDCAISVSLIIRQRSTIGKFAPPGKTATAGSDVLQSGRPIFDEFLKHLSSYIGNNSANVVFQMVKRLWLIRIDQ
ncbi:hypothetical protein TNCV_4436601 [Trichonephila clavipes]|nr:hypothetical protein TNCV_4436601 [Trichonephila clavipes]